MVRVYTFYFEAFFTLVKVSESYIMQNVAEI